MLIARLPEERSIGGRSHCPYCGKTIRLHELIPVISFLLLEGKCSGCHHRISWQYPLVESASAILFWLAIALFPESPLSAVWTAFGLWALLLIAVIDAHTQSIPDILSLLVAIMGLALHWWLGDLAFGGALIGLAFFGLQWAVSKGRWVGSGDVLLAGAMGLFLSSWQLMLVALMAAYIIGATFAVAGLLLQKTKAGQSIAFGPFLVMGTILAFVYGEEILRVFGF